MTANNKPSCIGIIMDGNRRWAKELGKPSHTGHKAGYDVFKRCIQWAVETHIPNLIFYALSTENLNREKKEVEYLFSLIKNGFAKDLKELHQKNIRFIFLGQLERLPKDVQEVLAQYEKETKNNTGITVGVAVSYGGRAEILHAVNTVLKEKGKDTVTEEEFAQYLWTHDIPDPDLIIRTGDALRLSNFLPWQSVYSELYFTDTYWPDFDKEEFNYILEEYAGRTRRMGK